MMAFDAVMPPASPDIVVRVHDDPCIYRIRLPIENEFAQPTNCFLVLDGGEALLIDTGARGDVALRLLNGALDNLAVDRCRLTVVLTHLHLDHAGLVDRIAPPRASVVAGAGSITVCNPVLRAMWRCRLVRAFRREGAPEGDVDCIARSLESSFVVPERTAIDFVGDGCRLKVGSCSFEVIETPGHTRGHIVLFEPQSRLLIGGDLLLFNSTSSVEFSADGTDDLQLYLDSLRRVQALDCSHLLVAHGEADGDCGTRIEWILRRNGEIARAMESEARAVPLSQGIDLVKRVYWSRGEDAWRELRPVRKLYILFKGFSVIQHLVVTGRLERVCGNDGLWAYRTREDLPEL